MLVPYLYPVHPACLGPGLPGLMLKVLWIELRRMQVTVLMTACMCEKSCMAQSGKTGAEPFWLVVISVALEGEMDPTEAASWESLPNFPERGRPSSILKPLPHLSLSYSCLVQPQDL